MIYVVDIETPISPFICVAKNIETKEILQFVVHNSRDDREKLFKWLDTFPAIITFNGLKFDYPVLHWMMINKEGLSSKSINGETFSMYTYQEAQRVIEEEFPEIPPQHQILGVQDLYRIHHFDNVAKHASLKHIQGSMYWPNMQELPFDPHASIPDDKIADAVKYCINDVESTEKLYELTKPAIEMRKKLGKLYGGIDLVNDNDPKLGEKILLHRIAKKMHIHPSRLKHQRTARSIIDIGEIMLPVEFNSKAFNTIKDRFSNLKVAPENFKGNLSEQLVYDNMLYSFGLGGLHASRQPNIYIPRPDHYLILSDVSSFYPNIAIKNNFAPEHLGKAFTEVYEEIYKERQNYSKGTPENYGLKQALTGAYGKSNSEHSFLQDPKFTMQITINGQLQMAKLCEMHTEAGNKVLYANTDGIICETGDASKYLAICDTWETMNNNVVLEHDALKALFLRDVNNYIMFFRDDSVIKAIGAYALHKDRQLHKDHSMNIIRKAAIKFFINHTPIRETIQNETNIYEFCLMDRTKKKDHFEMFYVDNQELVSTQNGHNIRYVIVNAGGGVLKKIFDSGKETVFHRGFKIRVLNKVNNNNAQFYNLNYKWYEKEARKLIYMIANPQTELNL